MEAQTLNCINPNDKKKMYLAGKMEIKLNNSCKKIKLFDHRGNSKIFDLKENIVLNSKNIRNFRNKFKNLQTHFAISKGSNDEFILKEDLNIFENTLLNKENKLIIKNNNINIKNNAIFLIEGKLEIENSKNSPTQIYSSDGTGSLIFIGNKFEFKDLVFKNLSSPKLNDLILYGGVNFINSEILLENITFNNSNDEDAINIINSKSFLSNIRFENIFADALDIDFGKSNFNNIECYNIKNDCLDISGAQINGNYLFTLNTNDKGISIGENSKVKIKNITAINNRVALAIKDGSNVELNNVSFENNQYDIALFNKKNEFDQPSLDLNNVNNLNKKKILQSKNTFFKLDKKILNGTLLDEDINTKLY